ncbi:MAG: GGDEF domain-containing protein [Steroidobacteraceae bacterium]|jgi:diguanylate cyclase (GGDEF)-like protein
MLRTFSVVPFKSKARGSETGSRGSLVSFARILGREPQRSRLERLERELDAARSALAAAKSEIVAMKSAEKRARYMAMHDGLTALPNRRFFSLRLDQALAAARDPQPSFALLYFDLDGFKQLNDAHGHHVGDELLRIVGSRLAHAVRAEDLVSRLGGDEFACLMPGKPQYHQLTALANKLYDAVRAPVHIGERELSVRPSIGIAIAPDDGRSADELLQHADNAMYRAKRQGSGHEFYSAQYAA